MNRDQDKVPCPSGTYQDGYGMETCKDVSIAVQYRHSIHAPVDRTSASAWLHKTP